jgi:hypothetical protein
MNQLFEAPDHSDLKREVEALRRRIEDLESVHVRPKAAGRSPRWRLSVRSMALPAVVVGMLLALGVLLADGNPDVLFIDPNGYVGINQTKPESPLDVNGGAQLRGNTVIGGDLSLGNSVLYFTRTDRRASATALQGGVAAIENSTDRAALEIFGRPTPTRRRVVAVSDRLGIGTSFPNATLDVGGDAIVSGSLTVDKIQGYDNAGNRNVSLWNRVAIGKNSADAPLDVKGEIRGKLWTSREYKWSQNQSQPVTQMTRADRSACFLTYARGLQGWGESVEIKQNDKGYWVLTGSSGKSDFKVEASARCIGAPDDAW